MRVENAQAGLLLDDSIITKLHIKNNLAVVVGPSFDKQILDVDFAVGKVFVRDNKDYVGELELAVRLRVKHERKTAFDLNLTMLGLYSAPNQAYKSKEDFSEALEINGLASLVSIARANIAAITSNVFCLGSIKMPMINVFMLRELKKQSNMESQT